MSEVGVEIIKTEETKESGIRYLNINVSNSEVERNPDIVRLCADAEILEYVKPKTGHWIKHYGWYECDRCHTESVFNTKFCPDCGCRMV